MIVACVNWLLIMTTDLEDDVLPYDVPGDDDAGPWVSARHEIEHRITGQTMTLYHVYHCQDGLTHVCSIGTGEDGLPFSKCPCDPTMEFESSPFHDACHVLHNEIQCH